MARHQKEVPTDRHGNPIIETIVVEKPKVVAKKAATKKKSVKKGKK